MKKMNEGERLIWAAAYVAALSWPGEFGTVKNAVWHGHQAVQRLRGAEFLYTERREMAVREARDILGLED